MLRCDLVTRDGVPLGQLLLAEGVTLAQVGRALLDRNAAAVPNAAAPAQGSSVASTDRQPPPAPARPGRPAKT